MSIYIPKFMLGYIAGFLTLPFLVLAKGQIKKILAKTRKK